MIAAILAFLLVYLPRMTRLVMGLWALAVRYRLDRDIPDQLPMTAGQWLARRLAEMPLVAGSGKPVKIVVTDDDGVISIDGYHPRQGVIQLTQETYFKSDPVFWAIAGHELGHAVIKHRHRTLTAFLTAAGWIKWALVTFGLGIAAGNVLYGVPEVSDLAHTCLASALALDLLVLLDEALASGVADRLLAREPSLTREHVRAARMMLIAAFMTYVATFVAHAGLLTFWPRLVDVIGSGYFDGVAAPLQGWRWAIVAGCTAILVMHALLLLLRVVAGPPPFYTIKRETRVVNQAAPLETWLGLAKQIALLSVLALVWDQSADMTYWWCVLLAFIPAFGSVTFFLSLPLLFGWIVLVRAARKLYQRYGGIDESRAYREARGQGEKERRSGNRFLAKLAVDAHNKPAIGTRLAWLARGLYLPLLIAYWF